MGIYGLHENTMITYWINISRKSFFLLKKNGSDLFGGFGSAVFGELPTISCVGSPSNTRIVLKHASKTCFLFLERERLSWCCLELTGGGFTVKVFELMCIYNCPQTSQMGRRCSKCCPKTLLFLAETRRVRL